jgi:3'-phosphoadenosine 5'-phosphosulfate sulfotransferase (PAPS reductase)/FAD synthetase
MSGQDAEAVMLWAHSTFTRLALVASLQAESSVLIDMASRNGLDMRVITLDTGRLPQETHDMIDRVRDRYGIEVDVVAPAAADVSRLVHDHGTNPFYRSVELRRLAARCASRVPSPTRSSATTRGSQGCAASRQRRVRKPRSWPTTWSIPA